VNPYFHRRDHTERHFRPEATRESNRPPRWMAHARPGRGRAWIQEHLPGPQDGGHDATPGAHGTGLGVRPGRGRGAHGEAADCKRHGPPPEGRIAARVFYLFEHGRELREIVQELEIAPGLVRDLWHEWLSDLEDGELARRKTASEERRRRADEEQMRELERRGEQDQKNFETIMAAMTAATGGLGGK
jgi:hypothetical protein